MQVYYFIPIITGFKGNGSNNNVINSGYTMEINISDIQENSKIPHCPDLGGSTVYINLASSHSNSAPAFQS